MKRNMDTIVYTTLLSFITCMCCVEYSVTECINNNACCNGSLLAHGKVMEDLKSQVASLQANLHVLKELHNKTSEPKPEFYINFCTPTNERAEEFYILNAMGSNYREICQAMSSKRASVGNYQITVNLFNLKGREDTNYGHPGVIFNAVDSLNFDFIYFRPHSSPSCYQTGYMTNGARSLVPSSFCPYGIMVGKAWTKINILVHNNWAYVLMKNQLVDVIKTRYGPRNRGGAFTWHGYGNTVFFKDYQVSKLPSVPALTPESVKKCSAGTGWLDSSTLVLSALGSSFKASGFCRVRLQTSLSRPVSKYQFTVKLQNVRSTRDSNVGHPGVMYNILDMDNFDFVYFRPHSASGCYQTGYMRNSVTTFRDQGSCSTGPPGNRIWFTVNVKVHSQRNVQIFLDGHHVKTLVPQFPMTQKAGVIVQYGYENIIQAKQFQFATCC